MAKGDLNRTAACKRVRRVVLERDGYLCQIRGPKCTEHATEVDHIVRVVDGGELLDPAGLRAACRPCNRGRRPGKAQAGAAAVFVPDPSLPYSGCTGSHPVGGSVPCPRCGCTGPSRAW